MQRITSSFVIDGDLGNLSPWIHEYHQANDSEAETVETPQTPLSTPIRTRGGSPRMVPETPTLLRTRRITPDNITLFVNPDNCSICDLSYRTERITKLCSRCTFVIGEAYATSRGVRRYCDAVYTILGDGTEENPIVIN